MVASASLSPAFAEEDEEETARPFFSRGSGFLRDSGRGVFFSTFDAAERDRFIGWGFTYAPRGRLDEPGWRFMTTSGVKLRDIDPSSGIRSLASLFEAHGLGDHWCFVDWHGA